MSTWDPEVLARIGHLHLRARQAVSGVMTGGHKSVTVASNVEFADYKEYSPGDPLKDLDWKVAARTDRLVVRRHHAEHELRAVVVLDASGDLGTGKKGRYRRPPLEGSKFGYAVTLAATLVWFLHKRGEPVGLVLLGGEGARWPVIPARGGATHASQVLANLASVAPAGRADLGKGIREVGARLTRRGLVVLVSDFMEEPSSWGPALSALGQRRADIRAVHLYDPTEWALEYKDPRLFWSPEGGAPLPVDPRGAGPVFREVVDEYLAEVRGYLGAHRASHVLVPTDQPLERSLARLVQGW